ncbi:MAG: hypothetical protein HWN80_02810 [Candidatus Lokiarchaeota archaeon]|nr:hypothetical protein [Candidatus Lokiarchaeota archaeon]
MDDHLSMFSRNVIQSRKDIISIEDMLNAYPWVGDINLEKGHDFEASTRKGKIIPSIKFATEKDAEEITKIFKEVYENTYPYKRMENFSDIQNMIRSPNYYWIVFTIKPDIIVGCVGIRLDFENKIGHIFGFALRKEFQQKTDISTALVGSLVAPMHQFKNQILYWFAEVRSSFSSVQYIAKLTGLSPVGFLPNKDIFFNQPESEILFITYSQEILSDRRSSQRPQLITPAIFCYFYAFQKYDLGLPVIRNNNNLEAELDSNIIENNRKHILRRIERDKYGNEQITISIMGTDNFFQLLHYKNIQIVEKVDYNVSTLEDLYVLLEEIKSIIKEFKLRYMEVFLSAYDSTHQTFFYNAGFKPMGYIPAFKYNKDDNLYEDRVLFVYHENPLNKNTQLIRETEEFLESIKYLKELRKK